MSPEKIFYLIPYIGSLGLSTGILIYAWMRRHVKGATPFALYVAAQTLWVVGFIHEMVSSNLTQKIFWDKFQWLAGFIILIALPLFSVQFTEQKVRKPRLFWGLLSVFPSIFLLTVLSDPLHHQMYPNPHLISGGLFPELTYDFTWTVYVISIYGYLVMFSSIAFLLFKSRKSQPLYLWQTITLAIGFLVPIVGTIFALLDIQITDQRDPTPLTSAIGNFVIALGLFRYRTFQVNPVARDHIFEALIDPVVILDNHNHIVDINRSMLDLLGIESDQAVGQPVGAVFNDFPIPIKMYAQTSYARTETSFEIQGKSVYYEMTVWPRFDKDRKMAGRIYISHDITALKELESELRILNRDLESRVQARTQELAEAYDTTLKGWAKALEYRDKETEDHSRRVTELTVTLAQVMGIREDDLIHLRRVAILHDIGKMAIPDEILRKRGPLTDSERKVVEQHPVRGYELLSSISFLEKALDIPYCHHERWDGSGYPRGLKGDEIPLSARIFSIIDVWDALLSNRPYSKPWPKEKALAYLAEQAGKQFDPNVVDTFLNLVKQGKI